MKKITFLTIALFYSMISIAQNRMDTLFVYEPSSPLIINRQNNVVLDLRINPSRKNQVLQNIKLQFANDTMLRYVKSLTLYYSGTGHVANGSKFDNPSYNIRKFSIKPTTISQTIDVNQALFGANNYFWVGLTLDPKTPLTAKFALEITSVIVDNQDVYIKKSGVEQPRRVAMAVRSAGDDGVNAYRIPGIATSTKGTLLAVYDVRRNSAVDLQEDVQIGLSRSFDGGRTWQPMQIAVDMRGIGGLPDSQNGVGDPAILVDNQTGNIWIMGLYTHGMGNQRAWNGSAFNAMEPEEQAAQVVVACSSDDGQSWQEPVNITSQIKQLEWGILLQGPGMGITMKNGTLVFAFQYRDADKIPHATIIYSEDKGKSWTVGESARSNTTEAQVVELNPGELMLNMRDNRGGSRAVLITKDMGKTWSDHPSSRGALIEPICMASIIKVDGNENITGNNILLFSNPADENDRKNMTIKISKDNGITWNKGLLLDDGSSWGYSCLTMIDPATVGILYEGSQAQMTFQAIPLIEILAK